MADITLTIPVSDVKYTAWLRTSYIALSKLDNDGIPMIKDNELGPDQEDAFTNYMNEATLELSKLFASRQGDAAGSPFEYDGSYVIFRFKEGEPVLTQKAVLESQMIEDITNALYSFISILWYNAKDKESEMTYFIGKYGRHALSIERNLYLLHD